MIGAGTYTPGGWFTATKQCWRDIYKNATAFTDHWQRKLVTISATPALKDLDIVCTLERNRVIDVPPVHPTADITDRSNIPSVEPLNEPRQKRADVTDSVSEQGRSGHDRIGAGQDVLYDLIRTLDTGAGSKRCADLSGQHSDP